MKIADGFDISGATFNPSAPFDGYEMSGCDRELDVHGLEELLENPAAAIG